MEVPSRALPGQCLQFRNTDMIPDLDGEPWFPRQEGACVFQFPGNLTTALILIQMQELGFRVLVDVDDNYLKPWVGIPGVVSAWEAKLDKARLEKDDPYSNEQHRDICKFVDGIIVSTPELAKWYGRVNDNVYVCPNSVDPGDWPKQPPHQETGILHVGYAGSSSHWWDVDLLRRAFGWLETKEDVQIHLIGEFEASEKYKVTRWTDDLNAARRNLQPLDVGFAPLRDAAWTRCKSDIKMMEYAMAGAAGVFSIVEPYKLWTDLPGYGCKTEKDFLKVAKHIYRNRDEVRETARLAREYVMRERLIAQNIHHWEEAIDGREEAELDLGRVRADASA
jgi:glycosyltransferase involved in cell wall biosynthesis